MIDAVTLQTMAERAAEQASERGASADPPEHPEPPVEPEPVEAAPPPPTVPG